MRTARFPVDKNMCESCALALRRFVGGLDGVRSIEAVRGEVLVTFDENTIPDDTVVRITRESIEKLGYRVDEHA